MTFGDQIINDQDANLLLRTSFYVHPVTSACVLKIAAEPLDPANPVDVTSVIFYAVAAPEDEDKEDPTTENPASWGSLRFDNSQPESVRIAGSAESLGGAYTIKVHEPAFGGITETIGSAATTVLGEGSRARIRARADKPEDVSDIFTFRKASSSLEHPRAWAVEQGVRNLLSPVKGRSNRALHVLQDKVTEDAPGVFVQRLLNVPFEMEATFVLTEGLSEGQVWDVENELTGQQLETKLKTCKTDFDQRFERTFKLKEKGIEDKQRAFARTTLANVLGGIGYFYGRSLQRSGANVGANMRVRQLKPVGLLTATPSRAVFPRGFLWDEGFHQLIIQRWDPHLSVDCLKSWFEAIQESGWIPREQILGSEARTRFPDHIKHLVVQDPVVANPPTILIPLRLLMENESTGLDGMIDKVKRYYTWLKETQSGELMDSFRWRGRSDSHKAPDGYPLTLASGLDDYPRGEKPNTSERHVDLHSWVAWASGLLARLAEGNGDSENAKNIWAEHERLKESLLVHHGSSAKETSDIDNNMLLCDYDGDKRICHEGYVTLLPFILGLLDPSDPRIQYYLDSLANPSGLRARAGIRSLSKKDMWHRKGDDYWTGSVWMPFNYLTLAALKTRYGVLEGPYKARAQKIYKELRSTILDNTYRVFVETGQIWENYAPDEQGDGKSGRQFAGWSALILLIYAEMFDGII